jgi:hypothetical protein
LQTFTEQEESESREQNAEQAHGAQIDAAAQELPGTANGQGKNDFRSD